MTFYQAYDINGASVMSDGMRKIMLTGTQLLAVQQAVLNMDLPTKTRTQLMGVIQNKIDAMLFGTVDRNVTFASPEMIEFSVHPVHTHLMWVACIDAETMKPSIRAGIVGILDGVRKAA